MVEIILLVLLCKANAGNAADRGHSKGGAIAYTIALWFVPEFFVGFILGCLGVERMIAVVCALIAAGLGALISNRLSKIGTTRSIYDDEDENERAGEDTETHNWGDDIKY